jgi:flagellar protein FliS
MIATPSRAARAYGQVTLTSGVDSASPHQLVLMLFDGALTALRNARAHLAAGRVGPRGEAVSQAIQIVEQGLRASLDRDAGGALAGQLADLYEYIGRRILVAGAKADDAGLAEAARLLEELRGAWTQIDGRKP